MPTTLGLLGGLVKTHIHTCVPHSCKTQFICVSSFLRVQCQGSPVIHVRSWLMWDHMPHRDHMTCTSIVKYKMIIANLSFVLWYTAFHIANSNACTHVEETIGNEPGSWLTHNPVVKLYTYLPAQRTKKWHLPALIRPDIIHQFTIPDKPAMKHGCGWVFTDLPTMQLKYHYTC